MTNKIKTKSKKKADQEQETLEDSFAIISYAKKLFKAADTLRKNIDAAEYKHPVLGLIFLKYISDAFEERRRTLIEEKDQGADPVEKTEYIAAKVFWVTEDACWSKIQDSAKKPGIGKIIDDAMIALEHDNESLKGVLPKNYASQKLDPASLGKLVDLFSKIPIGGKKNQARDVLGRIYEYFLAEFASQEGKKGGQFYTPSSVVRLLVEMIEPREGRLYEPCCGSGGMIVQSERFMDENQLLFYGQESNQTTWRLCKMNLAIRAIDADEIKWNPEGSFIRDEHKTLKADYVLANPHFNDSDWSGENLREDPRWVYGVPPISNANYAWIQHFISHLSNNGIAGFVLANGSLSSQENTEEYEIRKSIVDAGLVDCIVRLPTKLFFSTPISATLWFLRKNKSENFPHKEDETLFIDARDLGVLITKKHRELLVTDIEEICNTYHSWLGKKGSKKYHNINGFCYSASKDEIINHHYSLVPGKYTGTEKIQSDSKSLEETTKNFKDSFLKTIDSSKKLDEELLKQLRILLND